MRRGLWTLAVMTPIVVAAPLAIALVSGQPLDFARDAAAQAPAAGVFTAEQAAAGRAVYTASCASCHLPDLAGRNEAPQLAGNNFMNTWRARTTRDLFEFIQSTMPPAAASLNDEQYLAVTAFLLQANGARPGATPFAATTTAPIGSVAVRAGISGGAVITVDPGTSANLAGGGRAGAGQRQGGAPATAAAQGGGRGGAPANAGPIGLTATGTVKNYVPVTDEMLRNQDP